MSAGLLLYRNSDQGVEVLVGHMGGPFWSRKDDGAWSIPKGEYDEHEEPQAAALREFQEELGAPAPAGTPIPLGEVRQSGGKVVTVYALEGDFDAAAAVSNTFELEWPRGSGVMKTFPELDRVAWLSLEVARTKLVKAQGTFLDRLRAALTT
ncbi:NUDIX domain-containing protein [Dactylosporangium aurantiacum]|uniref:NUDIX domain-containing protein n=1 Tax=Dactylosporangium aurantiacum TaxID=35754 RepID=A0A9Q9IK90_9ACTN|nr:NUDIX domain-containing protein [Dactylosporangium aurantiacum]MDG6110242.1 NUDIX domain-containing protein [Dactylosporangium aurantiacum]UWZ55417.1 NUDIX domain-containing protein [Dactylosporangium aurantiacum]